MIAVMGELKEFIYCWGDYDSAYVLNPCNLLATTSQKKLHLVGEEKQHKYDTDSMN